MRKYNEGELSGAVADTPRGRMVNALRSSLEWVVKHNQKTNRAMRRGQTRRVAREVYKNVLKGQ